MKVIEKLASNGLLGYVVCMCVRVCVCVCACVRACVRVCVAYSVCKADILIATVGE